jgi:sugar O-acyltransferase (sialic acid O-acetyltransferase NeuD family)
MQRLAIVGASGHGKVVADLAELLGYEVAFYDDAYPKKTNIEHWSVIGTFDELLKNKNDYKNAVVAIGNNSIRAYICHQLINANFNLPLLIHPSAVVSKYAKISSGSVVFASAVVNAFAQVGQNCIINTGAVVEHDCVIDDGVHLSPNVTLAGGTKIGKLSWLGLGSVTKQLIEVGTNTTVGANSTVTKNIPSNVTAFGSPAAIKKNQ